MSDPNVGHEDQIAATQNAPRICLTCRHWRRDDMPGQTRAVSVWGNCGIGFEGNDIVAGRSTTDMMLCSGHDWREDLIVK